ncbi:SIS domain-containing protein [Sphaerisporangium sp. NPDC049002]|uniref:SIS domain-containing protein n=1 Tax=unclassified Sphaerisporangium TaxID=2630420 RepID=UPI0033C6FAFC
MAAAANDVLSEGREAVRREAGGVLSVADQLDDSFVEAARLLYDCEGKVFVTGAGTSGAVARRMAHLLSVCGTPALFIQAADALHGTMGAVTAGDILIAISRGGGSMEINDLTTRVRERGARVIALTAVTDSELGNRADLVVKLESPPGVDPGEVIAMGSTLVTAVWGDALAYVLMRLRGYGWEQVLHSHPSGAVGQIGDAPDPLPALTFDAGAGAAGVPGGAPRGTV